MKLTTQITDENPLVVMLYAPGAMLEDQTPMIKPRDLAKRPELVFAIDRIEIKDKQTIQALLAYITPFVDETICPVHIWVDDDGINYQSLVVDVFQVGDEERFDEITRTLYTIMQEEMVIEYDAIGEIELAYPDTWNTVIEKKLQSVAYGQF